MQNQYWLEHNVNVELNNSIKAVKFELKQYHVDETEGNRDNYEIADEYEIRMDCCKVMLVDLTSGELVDDFFTNFASLQAVIELERNKVVKLLTTREDIDKDSIDEALDVAFREICYYQWTNNQTVRPYHISYIRKLDANHQHFNCQVDNIRLFMSDSKAIIFECDERFDKERYLFPFDQMCMDEDNLRKLVNIFVNAITYSAMGELGEVTIKCRVGGPVFNFIDTYDESAEVPEMVKVVATSVAAWLRSVHDFQAV